MPDGTVTSNDKAQKPVHLKNIPGEKGWPIFGHTFEMLKNPEAFSQRMQAKYGPIYRSNVFFRESVTMYGPDANEFLLMDKEKCLSSELGWAPYLKRLFPRGLMLMDFDNHKAHRHIMTVAFKTGPMKGYLERLNDTIPERIKAWGDKGSFKFYPAVKKLSLDMATTVFLGLKPGKESAQINKALTDMVSASVGIVRVPIPGTIMWKGVKGRQFIVEYLSGQIESRRASKATDLFTQLCQAQSEDGASFTDQEIIDHMIFLWMAAHDTITSSVTTLVYELGRNKDWQEKLRAEIKELGLNNGRIPYELLNKLPLTEYAFKEALRLNPPVPAMPRRTKKDVEFAGHHIPEGTILSISTVATHRNDALWDTPRAFDPMRFSPEGGVKSRHKFAWIPFGGGAHMCIGLHFAYMQAKVIMAQLLPHYSIELPEGYSTKFQILPLIKPVDGLPVTLKAIG